MEDLATCKSVLTIVVYFLNCFIFGVFRLLLCKTIIETSNLKVILYIKTDLKYHEISSSNKVACITTLNNLTLGKFMLILWSINFLHYLKIRETLPS